MRTVTIPRELDKAMRRAKNINWSAVAAAAFEQKLREKKCVSSTS